MKTRYQHCSWLVRRWRDLWLLCVPFWFARWYVTNLLKSEDRALDAASVWSIARGWCDYKRHYYYTWAEVKERL